MIAKKTLRELIDDVPTSTPENRLVAQLEYQKAVQQMKADVGRIAADPNWRAMKKMESAINAMKSDPEITASEPCIDFLDLMSELLALAWPHHDVQRIVAPMQKHFDEVKSKAATEKLQQKREKGRDLHHTFLDQQDTTDTVKLAARLRKKFALKSERGSEDAVRAWKKLRLSGRT